MSKMPVTDREHGIAPKAFKRQLTYAKPQRRKDKAEGIDHNLLSIPNAPCASVSGTIHH
jgi:hypothetical protein